MRSIRRPMLYILLCCLLAVPAVHALAGQASVTGFAFVDKNLNGLFDNKDTKLPGVELTLIATTAAGEERVAAALTDEEGRYTFTGLAAGRYHMQAVLPRENVPTRFEQGGSRLIPSASFTARTAPFALDDGQSSVDQVLLGAMPAKSGSFVRATAFGDDNLNGGRFSSEPLLKDVQMELLFELDGEYYVVGAAATNKEGIGTISGVAPGTYVLGATLPQGYIVGPLGEKMNPFYNAVQPSESSYGRTAPFNLPARGSVGMGIGGAVTGSGSGKVWLDSNFNGLWDADEQGLAGVRILLTHQSMGVERRLETDADGSFDFPTLQPGSYTLAAELPSDYMFTIAKGDSTLSSDKERSATATVMISAKQASNFGSIGVIPNTALSLFAFHDSNLDGQWQEGEPPFSGARLQVLRDGKPAAEAATDGEGIALIPLLRAGNLQLRLELPDGQIFSVPGGEQGNLFFSATAESSLMVDFSLQPGTTGKALAGITLPAAISGQLFDDLNTNGAWEEGESMLPGFTVQAINQEGVSVAETVTDEEGSYHLSPLVPGSYQVRFLLQTPYIFSEPPEHGAQVVNKVTHQTAEYGQTEPISLRAGETVEGIDGAIFRSAIVRGQVLLGDDIIGFDGTQGGLPGVFVELLDESGAPVSEYTTATTDEAGAYLVKGALPGTYSLRYTLPEDAAYTQPLTDDKVFTSQPFTVKASDELDADTLFAVQTGTFAGLCYVDGDVNGARDETDAPLAGVQVQLISATEVNSRQAISNAEGQFVVSSLRPGDYQLTITLPEGKLISLDEHSPLAPAISNSSSVDLTITMAQRSMDNRIAAVDTHSLTGRIYMDNNLDRALTEGEPPFVTGEISLRHGLTKVEFTAQPDAQGAFTVPVLFPGEYTLSVPLQDDFELYAPEGVKQSGGNWEATVSMNAASAQTALDLGLVQFGSIQGALWTLGGGDHQLDNLPISLYRTGESEPVQQVQTDAQGNYEITGLYPGSYELAITLPEGVRFARLIDSQMTRFSLITSDGNGAKGNQGRSAAFPLAMAENRQAQDIGMGTLGRLGDYAWLDLDKDGMQDAGEPGVPGIIIKLYQYGQVVAETTTDEYGRYLFSDVYPGPHELEVTMWGELKTTRQQDEFVLVASILPEGKTGTALAQGILVPSGGRNLNCDLGFVLITEGQLPTAMLQPPRKDWTPLVPTVPKRTRD